MCVMKDKGMFFQGRLGEKGLGLLEVLAAMALLALGVTFIFGSISSAAAWNQEAARSTQAINLAVGIIEYYKARPDQIRARPETAVSNLDIGMEEPPGVTAAVTITEYHIPGLYQVTVRVRWSVQGVERNEVLGCVWPGS